MKNNTIIFGSSFESLDSKHLNLIRGGSKNKGGSMPIDEDILLPDPEPGEPDPYI